MDFGSIIGQLMQGGLSPKTEQRLQHSVSDKGLGGLGDLLGGAIGDLTAGGGGLQAALGGVGDALARDSGVGGLSRGEVGGIGAIAGALLGGGGGAVKGAVGGGAMALLGTLAISALKNWQEQARENASTSSAPRLSDDEVQQMNAPETAELCLLGMIEAVKSDGEISREEVERIVGKLEQGGITAEEQRFVREQMESPSDLRGLIAQIPNREVGVQVYAAALMAISVDTEAERRFPGDLAYGAHLDHSTLERLHDMVGAPSPA